jgi:hypothetical protein
MARTGFMQRLTVGALALALAACGESGPNGTTSLSVQLKDAPGDFHTAVVTISEVDLVGSGGVTVLSTTPTTVDLLTLANSTADLVKDFAVPSGTYTELRIKLSGGYIEVENADGSTSIYASSPTYTGLPAGAQVAGQLQMPSLAQSGLKVTMANNALDITGDQKILLIDFDVTQSFGHQAGGSGMWVLHPVITGGDISVTGGLHVTAQLAQGVTFDLGTASATLTDANDVPVGSPQPLTDTDANGVFEASFGFLAPGSYKVSITPPVSSTVTTDPASPAAVTVTSGGSTTAAFTVTAAQ